MADELQALLNRIHEEGLQEAEETKAKLIAQAQAEAADIVKKAQEEADACRRQAKADAELFVQKGEESLQQASRDIMLSLKQQLQSRVQTAVTELMSATLNAQQLPQIISDVAANYLAKDGVEDNLEILVSPEQLTVLTDAVKWKLAQDLKERCTLAPTKSVSGGFKLTFDNQDVIYDFTTQALAETISAFVSPRIAALLDK